MRPITKTISLHKELIFRQQDTACLENWLHLRIRLSKIEWCAARWSRFPLFGLTDIDAAVENVGNLEVFKLEKNLSTLASISGAAPMVGFLGTVTGMIIAFYKMASEQNVTPDVLAGGIYQALITTALGLVIGIFSFVGYNYLVAKVEQVIFVMERSTLEFMDLLQEPTR